MKVDGVEKAGNGPVWIGAAAVIVLLALLAHGQGVTNGWVFDDHRFVEQNEALDDLDVLRFFRDASTASVSEGIRHDIYRPLRTLDYAIDTALFGRERAGPFHAMNLLLHVLASLLVFRLAWRLAGESVVLGALAGSLFAVHPVGVECVAWISSRGDVLALVLMLGALIVMERPGIARTLAGTLLALLACFAKESALVLPALLVLRDLALPPARRLPGRLTALRTVLLVGVAAVYLAVRLQVIPGLAQVPEFPGGSRAAAARGMLSGLVWYAKAVVWPSGFPFDLHLPIPARFSDPRVVLGLGLLLTLLLAGLHGARRRTALAFATWGALACLVPVSNVLVPLKAVVAERFLYPVLVCVVVGVVWGLSRLSRRILAWGGVVGLLAVLVALVPVTRWRTRAWHDDLLLWETVLRERPDHMRAYEGLGDAYLRRGRIEDAETAYRSYLLYNPADAKSMVVLADAFGRVAGALRQARTTPGVRVGGAGRRRARVAQLTLYRKALDTWRRIGLVAGRGSPALLRHVHRSRIEAAYDLGDLGEAKRANDALLALDGFDPGDVDAVLSRAPFERRKARLNLALTAVLQPPPRGIPIDARRRYVKERGAVLADVGIEGARPDAEAGAGLLPLYRALSHDARAGPMETSNLVSLLDALGRKREANEIRRAAVVRWPDHPAWRRSP